MGKRKTPINWKVANKRQVERGRKLAELTQALPSNVDEVWQNELDTMNKGKIGPNYQYPDSLIIVLLTIKSAFGLSYRILEGYTSRFCPMIPDYSRIQRRISKLPKELTDKLNKEIIRSKVSEKLDIIADATGVQINGKNVWSDERFGTKAKRKWKKLHMVIDIKTNMILSCEVLEGKDNEGKHENVVTSVGKAIRNAGKSVSKFYGDGSYPSINNIAFFSYLGIKPVVRIRKDSVKKAHRKFCRGAKLSSRERLALEQYNWDKFVEEESYGKRSGIEGVIGSFKSFFGEKLFSKLDSMIEREVNAKVMVWNAMA